MNDPLSATLAAAAVLLSGAAVGFASAWILRGGLGSVIARWRRQDARATRIAALLRLHGAAGGAVWLVAGMALFLFGLVVLGSPVRGLLCILLTPLLLRVILPALEARRIERLQAELPAALSQLVAQVRTGAPLAEAITRISTQLPGPLGEELGQVARDQDLFTSQEAAFWRAGQRVPSDHYRLAMAALTIFSRRSGNLPVLLESMAASFLEISRLDTKVRSASISARLQFWMINGVLLWVYVMVSATNPQFISVLTGTPAGFAFLAVAVVTYVIGALWMRRMMQVVV
jgi:tight adherence protein B